MYARKLLVPAIVGLLSVGLGAASASCDARPAEGAAAFAAETLEGVIRSIDNDHRSFVMSVADDRSLRNVTIRVTDATKYTLDGKESTRDLALKVGARAKAICEDLVASSVAVTSEK